MSTEQVEKQHPLVEESSSPSQAIIWTPGFIMAFGLALVLGLSLQSVFAQGWMNKHYTGAWVFAGHVLLLCLAWIALLVFARGRWMRVGALFGLLWAAGMVANLLIHASFGSVPPALDGQVNVLVCLALLGSSLCMTLDRWLLRRWDAWLLASLPVVGALAVALMYLNYPAHTWLTLENCIALVALIASALVWVARPTCWKNAPAPTLLFGGVVVTLLWLDVANGGYNAVNYFLARVIMYPDYTLSLSEANFFFSQVALLFLLLGNMRLLKCELAN